MDVCRGARGGEDGGGIGPVEKDVEGDAEEGGPGSLGSKSGVRPRHYGWLKERGLTYPAALCRYEAYRSLYIYCPCGDSVDEE